jgi:hypothetical protein
MGTQEAHRLPLYSFTSPTLYDSSALGNARKYFLVSAHTDQPGAFYDSPVDSGQSVDNLVVSLPKATTQAATPDDPEIVSVTDIPRNEGVDNLPPDAPSHLSGASFANEARLHWGSKRAEDVRIFLVYRSTLPGINPLWMDARWFMFSMC